MKSRSLYVLAAIGGVAWLTLAAPLPTSGQNAPLPTQSQYPAQAQQPGVLPQALPRTAPRPAPVADLSPQAEALIRDLKAQSQQMAANQAAMDAKLDKIAENLRQARIYASRLGGKGGK